jgi:hypothetical protein
MKINRKLVIAAVAVVVVIVGILIVNAASRRNISTGIFDGTAAGTDAGPGTVLTDVVSDGAGSDIQDDTAVAGAATGPQEGGADGNSSDEGRNSASGAPAEDGRVKVKAIYLSGTSAGSSKILDRYIDVINKTELNSVVIDVKEAGRVNYVSSVPTVAENKLYVKYYDVDKVIEKLHDNNIHVIGRIVCFRDDGLAMKRTDLAIKRVDGSIWKEGKLGAWTNPYMEEVWRYNIDIAKEAAAKGFDEIQFDYVRFPTAKKSEVNYEGMPTSKVDAICSFLKKAKEELRDSFGIPVSADVFGIIAESRSDGEAIGQDLERVGLDIDYISPMVYPSHYAKGQEVNGVKFAKPDFEPYEVVYQTLLKAKDRISRVPGYTAQVRPYLQDFTASYLHKGDYQEYGAEQVRQQIKAVYDAGYEEWILWDGKNTYTVDALEQD